MPIAKPRARSAATKGAALVAGLLALAPPFARCQMVAPAPAPVVAGASPVVIDGAPPLTDGAPLETNVEPRARGPVHGFFARLRGGPTVAGAEAETVETITVHDLACMIDELDHQLSRYGKIAVKSPDIFGQNGMTGYRQDYENQMKTQLDQFELVLSSYRRRSDSAALTSATSVAAALQPPAAPAGRRSTTTTTTNTTNVAPPALALPLSDLFTNASKLVGTASDDLTPETAAKLKLANAGAVEGIGLEPTVALDERSNYLYHLNELRRINAGDDSTDVAGYGLYLVRLPISLLPSGASTMGKGASVTIKIKPVVTADLLPNTFRSVLVLDTAYSLANALNRGLFQEGLLDDPAPQAHVGAAFAGAAPTNSRYGVGGNAPSTEVLPLFGGENLKILVGAMKSDQITWYRHDPSTISWLLSELTAAHGYMREQAHRNHPMFQTSVFEEVADLVLQRKYFDLRAYRDRWLGNVLAARGGAEILPIDVLAFALIVQSVYLDRQIKYDMEFLAKRKGCALADPWSLTFYDLYPTAPEDVARAGLAAEAFAAYVEQKWPIHVFAMDPVIDQQNELDLFSQRSQLQLALAIALASGQVNFQNATSYARRMELDLETTALNRTAVGFGAGDTTFGWRFFPRVQTPPSPGNLRRIAGLLVNGGTGPYYDLAHRKIEPGPRECYALVVMPCFVPALRLTSTATWFHLKGRCAEPTIETTDMVRLGAKLQKARNGLERAVDCGRYRPEEIALLSDRLDQLEAMLPLRAARVDLPFEASLLGSEIFSSTPTGLAPRLIAWYGEPPREGEASSIFLLGTGFSVHETQVIAGGVSIVNAPAKSDKVALLSRNVMRIEVPAGARVKTVHAKDNDGVQRTLIDVHVATPNGISNHLLVEADPKPKPASNPATATAAHQPIQARYALLDGASKAGLVPVFLGAGPSGASAALGWPGAAGPAPASAVATVHFPTPGGGDLGAKTPALPVGPGQGRYVLSGEALDTFAEDLVDQLGKFGLLQPGKPPARLTSSAAQLSPAPGANANAGAGAAGPQNAVLGCPLIVDLVYVPVQAHVAPEALKVQVAANGALAPDPNAPADISIDWLDGARHVQTDIEFDLVAVDAQGKETPLGTVAFNEGPGGAVQIKDGHRVVREADFLAAVNLKAAGWLRLKAQPPGAKFQIAARTIRILPRLGGMPLAPVAVSNAFQIDVAQAADSARTGGAMARIGAPIPAADLIAAARNARFDPAVRRTALPAPVRRPMSAGAPRSR